MMRPDCPFVVLFLVVACCATAVAQPEFSHVGPHPPSPPPRWLDHAEQATLAGSHGPWRAWLQAHPDWRALFDPRTGAVEMAFGPAIPVCSPGAGEETVRAAARQVADEVLAVAGGDPETFETAAVIETPRIWYVHLLQKHGTFRVQGGRLCLRIDKQGRLLMWTVRVVDVTGLSLRSDISEEDAVLAAREHLVRREWMNPGAEVLQTQVSRWVYVQESRTGFVPTPALEVKLLVPAPRADWVVWVDAGSGRVLQAWNDIREHGDHGKAERAVTRSFWKLLLKRLLAYVYGTVSGQVHEGRLPYQSPVTAPFRDIYVNFPSGYAITDASGYYSYNGGSSVLSLSCGLDGPYIHGQSVCCNSTSHQATVSSGSHNIFFGGSSGTVAERDMVYFTNKTHARLKASWPNLTLLDNQISGYSGLTSGTCNAFYSPQAHTINFLAAGGGCNDMATSSTVVSHEYGHGITTRIYNYLWAWLPGHLGEGYSDCIAAATEDTALMGAGYSGVGTYVRDLDNGCQYPASCGTQIHARGKVIGGCYWHTREQFAAASGQAGKDYMDAVMFQHLAGAPTGEMFALAEMLLLDDNDGNLANGTPNAALFHQGFTVLHGVPWPLQTVTVDHQPFADTMDQVNDYLVVATVASFTGNPIAWIDVEWSVAGGAWQATPMTPGAAPDSWVGFIPNQAGAGTVRYYIVASDTAGNVGTHPAAAPNVAHSFDTLRVEAFIEHDFETPSGWTTGYYWNQDDWMNLAPGNPAHPYDPSAAYDGTRVWGNDLSPNGSWDGLYRPWVDNWLESPPFDCSGRSGVRLRYRRWLTVEDGQYDQALIWVSSDGGNTWTIVWQNAIGLGDHVDTAWIEHEIDISSLADNANDVRVVFELVSDGFIEYGGWNVDAFRLAALAAGPVLAAPSTAVPWSTWVLSVDGAPGDAVFIGVDSNLNATYVPGIGTLSLDYVGATFYTVIPFSPLPATGNFSLPLVVPPWSGSTWYFQGVLFRPVAGPLLSNVISVTIQ